jgi:hypothetical protein
LPVQRLNTPAVSTRAEADEDARVPEGLDD